MYIDRWLSVNIILIISSFKLLSVLHREIFCQLFYRRVFSQNNEIANELKCQQNGE